MNNMRCFVSFFLLLLSLAINAQLRVVDADSMEPIDFASVFDNESGKLLGLTDTDGKLPAATFTCKTISIQHINYGNAKFNIKGTGDNTLKMKSVVYKVPEVMVDNSNASKIRIKTYVRQYTILNCLPANVSEYNCNLYFDKKKPNSYPVCRIVSAKLLENKKTIEGQPFVLKTFAENNLPTYLTHWDTYKMYDRLKDGKREVAMFKDKKINVFYIKNDKQNKHCQVIADSGFVEKHLNIALFGISVANMYEADTYTTVYGKPSLTGIINKTAMFRIIHNKSKGFVDVVTEFYIQGTDYLTKEEYKEDKKKGYIPFVRPEGIPSFNPNIEKAMQTMTIKGR